jgi:uncharacterized protein
MSDGSMYHDGSRELQDQFDTRRLADRLETTRLHATFSERDRAFIERAAMFFLATADAAGQPDCSYKGGLPGFVRVLDDESLAFPDYDGNGMFRSLATSVSTPRSVSSSSTLSSLDDCASTGRPRSATATRCSPSGPVRS